MKGALAVGGTVTTGKETPKPPVRVGSAGGLLLVRLGTDSLDGAGTPPVMITGGAEVLVGVLVSDLVDVVVVDFSDVGGSVLVELEDLGVVAGVVGLVEVGGPVGAAFVFVFVFVFVFEVDWVFCDRTAVAKIPSTRPVKSGLFTLIFDVEYVQRQRSDEMGGVEGSVSGVERGRDADSARLSPIRPNHAAQQLPSLAKFRDT